MSDRLQEMPDLRVPPHAVEAEQAVIGGLLIDNNAWDKIADSLSESDFYLHDHRVIFQHIHFSKISDRDIYRRFVTDFFFRAMK